jgi:hypothetical protein
VVAPEGERESREDERKERKKKEATTEPLYRQERSPYWHPTVSQVHQRRWCPS